MIDPNLTVSVVTLVGLVSGFVYTWVREGRTRQWQLADARAVAEKLNEEAAKVAAKASQEAAETAKQLVHDAEAVANKALATAEKLAAKVSETLGGTGTSSVDLKIAQLQAGLTRICEHIEQADAASKLAAQAIKDEVLFNQKVKDAIDMKLKELNGGKK